MENTTTSPLTWRRIAAGWHVAETSEGTTYEASKDHRPGVEFWHLTRKSPRIGSRQMGSFTTLREAKACAGAHRVEFGPRVKPGKAIPAIPAATPADTFTKTTNGETHTYTRRQVGLHGKVHDASPTRYTRNGAGHKVAHPACGQRSSRFYPHYILVGHETDCEKCLNARPSVAAPVEPERPAAAEVTAVRTVKNGKATITVSLPDGTTRTVGGDRAARATVVLVEERTNRQGAYAVCCRGDRAAAEREAERQSTRTTMRHRGEDIPTRPIPTVAVPVVENVEGASGIDEATCEVFVRGWTGSQVTL